MKAFTFGSSAEIPVEVTVQWKPEVKTTRHVEGYKGHFEVLGITLPESPEDYIMEKYYESFQTEAEGME
jgi:hypothetical protein